MTSESKNRPYARPPTSVAVFAYVAEKGRNEFVPAGMLEHIDQGRDATFTYGTKYVQRMNPIEIDPVALPLKSEKGGESHHTAKGLSEFGGIRDAAPDAWGRRVIENKLKVVGTELPEVAYLIEAGSDRVGALDVRPGRESPPISPANSVVDLARLLVVADKIESDEEVPAEFLPYFNGLGTAGGARPKATVRDESGVLWLVKFPAQKDRACNAVLEGGALELARAAGIRVPPIDVRTIGSKKVLLIRRFDRYWSLPGGVLPAGQESWESEPGTHPGSVEGRIGLCSAMTILGLDEYAARNSSYAAIAQAIRARCTHQFIARDLQEMFARMVLNVIVNNNDDHLRNHAFIYDMALRGWRLSPLYDVLPMNVVASERYLHLSVGEHGRLATLDNALSKWPAFFSSREEALMIMHRVWVQTRDWMRHFEVFGASKADMAYLSGAIRRLSDLASPTLESELRGFSQ